MIEKTVKIVNKAGMHTRPAATIVKMASKYECDINFSKDGISVDGKSIIGVMTLAAEMGSEVTLTFDGKDEEEASKEIIGFFERGFDEL